ncbi:hypothetical protein QF038_000765 [Pseudarthrobacter sp. W1I19]|uniref:hypothetical protein n=1 Tax=Pseudarthrobacter sp. W1I19 TaxID=3042288 RepID=UPI002786C719|nr:hypothetical protein [Pseudarthrobacter sp. W1I19]MDQ0922257.1 hypothetical protein [Pseudarthrobacter sp. W1I19]
MTSVAPVRPDPSQPDTSQVEPAVHPAPLTRRQIQRLLLLGLLCTAGWLASVLVGHFVDCGPVLHRLGLAGHILALVLSFGTILVVDWLGLLWLLGKVEMHASGKLEAAAKPLIWGGLALLLASGALIDPDLTNPVTVVKLVSVLILMLNGLSIAPAMHQLLALPPRTRFSELTRSLRLRLMIALSVSQACWWTAVLIGLINSTLRRWTGA